MYVYACQLHDILIKKLDLVLYTDPADVQLVDDGVRSIDIEFRNDIIRLYDEYLNTKCHSVKIVTLTGDVPTRLNTIKQSINNLKNE